VRDLLEREGLAAILLRRSANFAWYTGGADNRVDHSSPFGVADLVITRDTEYVLTNTIEAPRMRDEQTPDDEVVAYPWYEDAGPAIRKLAGSGALAADAPVEGARDVTALVTPLRYELDADAIELYRQVGRETEAAMEETAAAVQPGMTEDEAAALLLAACRRRNLFAPVAMAAADGRISSYRHPVSHGATIEKRLMLVVCGERGGLYACLTRFVHFEQPDSELQRRFDACRTILDRLREEATRPGRTLVDAFADCRRFYAEAGFPDEWKLHHQGGMTGYATREIVATPSTEQEIRIGQAYAWNPSITGAKAEETFVLTDSGPVVLASAP
jgi:Xaa-Pro aminopeptidase